MHRLIPILLLALAIAGCDDPIHNAIRRDLHVIKTRDDALVPQAMQRLADRGPIALMQIEGAMHGATKRTRLRLVDVIERIGAPDSVPLLRHWARHANDPEVTDACTSALAAWAATDTPRGKRAKAAQAWLTAHEAEKTPQQSNTSY